MKITEAIELLDQLNHVRKRVRHVARYHLTSDSINWFIDQFQKVDDQVLQDVKSLLTDSAVQLRLDLDRLVFRIEELEQISCTPPAKTG